MGIEFPVYVCSFELCVFNTIIKVPVNWQNVLTLGGMRGGIAVALVLSLPVTYEYKDLFMAFTFSIVAINLVLNPIFLN